MKKKINRLGSLYGEIQGKTTIKQRRLIRTLGVTYNLKPSLIRKVLELVYDINMKESSIRTWTNYNYKVVRYEQNRSRYK